MRCCHSGFLMNGSMVALMLSFLLLVGCAPVSTSTPSPNSAATQNRAGTFDSEIALSSKNCPSTSLLALIDTPPSTEFVVNQGAGQLIMNDSQLSWNCDSRHWLDSLVERITASGKTDENKAILWITWVQSYFTHSCTAPIDEAKISVFQPVTLVKLRAAHCGQIARLLVDGFRAFGIASRVVQLNNHVVAEFKLGENWILADGDALSPGTLVRDTNGNLAGIDYLLDNQDVWNSLTFYDEQNCDRLILWKETASDEFWRSALDFVVLPESPKPTPYVIMKLPGANESNRFFGWDTYQVCDRSDENCSN